MREQKNKRGNGDVKCADELIPCVAIRDLGIPGGCFRGSPGDRKSSCMAVPNPSFWHLSLVSIFSLLLLSLLGSFYQAVISTLRIYQ